MIHERATRYMNIPAGVKSKGKREYTPATEASIKVRK